MDRSSRNEWLVSLACWTALVVLFTTHAYVYSTVSGQTISLMPILLSAVSEWYTWAALTPLVVKWARKYPVDGTTATKAVLANIAIIVVFGLLHIVLRSALRSLGLGGDARQRPFADILSRSLPGEFHASMLTCAVILCATHALEYYRRYQDRKLRTSQLEAVLAQAQLEALRMQINPHFLFNALNSVSALIDEDPKAANQMVARLGDFLRLTLKNNNQVSTLEQEMQFLKSYLHIEQVRFGDRLKIDIDVEPSTLMAIVPTMILQPIVENAFRHAISKVAVGHLRIETRRNGGQLELKILDNGPGLAPPTQAGVGLANTRARLETQYGSAHSLVLENRAEGGLAVILTLPYVENRTQWK